MQTPARYREENVADQIRDYAARRHLPDSHLDRWLKFDEPGRDALLEFATALRLRTGQIVAALDLVEEIGVRERVSVAALLSRPVLHRTLEGSGSAPERARRFLDELRAIRFPHLHQTVARLDAAIAAMRLPREIAVLLPRDLASDELTIQLKVSDGADLKHLLEELIKKRGDLAKIFEILCGSDLNP